MDGKETFRRAVRIMVDSAQRALKDASLSIEDVVPRRPAPGEPAHHPGGLRAPRGRQRTGRSSVIDRYGNTSSASIPLALVDAATTTGRIAPGDVLLAHGLRRRA